jgi:hypothetical protein
MESELPLLGPEYAGQRREFASVRSNVLVPDYLKVHYWWPYIHPKAVELFERQWLVNLILCRNYARLRDAVLAEMGKTLSGTTPPVLACTT